VNKKHEAKSTKRKGTRNRDIKWGTTQARKWMWPGKYLLAQNFAIVE
jgi:hypothetical protein